MAVEDWENRSFFFPEIRGFRRIKGEYKTEKICRHPIVDGISFSVCCFFSFLNALISYATPDAVKIRILYCKVVGKVV